jgi:hypothetical protein
VAEQVAQLDRVTAWIVRDVLVQGVLDAEQLTLLQHHDRRGGERLGHRGQAVSRIFLAPGVVLAIGRAVTLGHLDLPVAGDENAAADQIFVEQRLQIRLDLSFDGRGLVGCGTGRSDGDEAQE